MYCEIYDCPVDSENGVCNSFQVLDNTNPAQTCKSCRNCLAGLGHLLNDLSCIDTDDDELADSNVLPFAECRNCKGWKTGYCPDTC